MNGAGGYSAWRWIFIIEGLFTIVIAAGVWFLLPDWPEKAKHLNEQERTVLLNKLARDQREYVETKSSMQVLKDVIRDPKLFCRYVSVSTAMTGSMYESVIRLTRSL